MWREWRMKIRRGNRQIIWKNAFPSETQLFCRNCSLSWKDTSGKAGIWFVDSDQKKMNPSRNRRWKTFMTALKRPQRKAASTLISRASTGRGGIRWQPSWTMPNWMIRLLKVIWDTMTHGSPAKDTWTRRPGRKNAKWTNDRPIWPPYEHERNTHGTQKEPAWSAGLFLLEKI